MSHVWINGTLFDKHDALVSPFDHGFLYGDGAWEALRAFKGQLLYPVEHLQNLFRSARTLDIDIPHSLDELIAAIATTLNANQRTQGYVRVIVTRGPGTIGPDPRKLTPQVLIIAEEYQPFPQELYGSGLHAVIYPVPLQTRPQLDSARTLGQLHIPLAKQFALKNGCLEAILMNPAAELVGTTEGSLFFVNRNGLVVPDHSRDPLARFVREVAQEQLPVASTESVRFADLNSYEEVFVAGVACGVIGIVRVNDQTIGSGEEGAFTRKIRAAYNQFTQG
jgi:branched-chain amino acid aminotransferase